MPALWLKKLGLAIIAPLLLFLLLEVGLRLLGVGRNTDFFVPDETPGVFRTNPRYTELFFPASFGLKPVNFRLSKSKPAGTTRIFVIGESAAMGVPEPGFSIAPQLRAQLRAAFPGRSIDVYNLGVTAINSHVIRHIVRQAVDFQPDLLVVYMGNNEVVGPFGPSSAWASRVLPLWVIRVSLWVRSTRTGQVVQQAVQRLAGAARDFKDWRGMEMFAGNAVTADDPRLETVYGSFATNLADILAMADDAGVKTLLSTVAVNVGDCAPFVSRHGRTLSAGETHEWQEACARAETASELGNATLARASFERALEIDPGYAETHFAFAKFLHAQGDAEGARRHLLMALERDALRFRADARINEIIRRAAIAGPGVVTLVDTAYALDSGAKATGVPSDHRLFFEHVHLTWEGNYLIARLLAPEAARILFDGTHEPSPWLSAEACAAAIGFTELGRAVMLQQMEALTSRPPFTGQRNFAADRRWFQESIQAVNRTLSAPGAVGDATATVTRALEADPANPFLVFHSAMVNAQAGDLNRALELNSRLASLQPPSPEEAAQKAFLLGELKRPRDAEEVLLKSAQTDPYYFQTYALLGRAWATTGQLPRALEYFESLAGRMPESQTVQHTLAQLFAHSGNMTAAEQQWQAILRVTPDDEDALAPLVKRLYERQQPDVALELMLRAYAYNPRSFANNARLLQVFDERGDLANTAKYMQALADSGPVTAALHFELAAVLSKLGRNTEMTVELHRAQKAALAEGDEALLKSINDLLREQ